MEHNEMIRRHRIATNVCVTCTEGLEEATEEVALKANTYGMDALTEYEQCFLEGSGRGRCPECIESQQDMDAILGDVPIMEDVLNGRR